MVFRSTADALYLVGGAGGPLGGDELSLAVAVGDSACLAVRSAAATLAQPGSRPGPSYMTMRFTVGNGATLDWQPEPLVSVQGSDHLLDTTVALSSTARLRLVDELVLGRAGEAPGRLRVRCRVTREGVAILAHDLDLGAGSPGWDSAAVLGDARAVVSVLVVGPDAPATATVASDPAEGSRAAWLPLAPDAALLLALAPTLLAARRIAHSLGSCVIRGVSTRLE